MNLIVVGTNHKHSVIALRERISFSKKRLKDALFLLKERDILNGAAILSTCNRVEIYASVQDSKSGVSELEDFISRYHEIDRQKFSSCLYIYQGREAARHLFSVASGLDSLILGETQILDQVKFAFSEAEHAGFVDQFLEKIFYAAVSFAKNIHRETKISAGKVSAGSVAVDFIKEKLGNLSGKNILIIGVGKVAELVLRSLKKEEPNLVLISNRTFERAKELAARIGAKAVRFDEFKQFLKQADVIITATASPHFIIKSEMLIDRIPNTGDRKLMILDLALPRDVDPLVREIENVDLFSLEDLVTVIKRNIEKKSQEAEKAENSINIELEKIWKEFTKLELEPVLWP